VNHKPDTFALSEAEHERIFRKEILPTCIPDGLTQSPQPTAVILGGQPGAGKTALLEAAEADLRAIGATVVINGDDLRSFHPQYKTLQRSDPENAAQLTNLDSGKWVEKVIAAGIERQVNLVIESTMRNSDVFASTARKLHDAGYGVEARAIAVNERVSWQGIHTRYEGMIEHGAAPRFTVREAHDAGAAGMLVTLRRIEDEKLAERVLIGTGDGRVIYDNALDAGQWRQPPRAAEAVQAERRRALAPAEIAAFADGWSKVIAKMERRGADENRIETARQQASDDDTHFRKLDANAQRAKLYLEQSRAASAGMPELRDAVALESYVERKLQREYGDRPELVSRGLNEARRTIANMIRQGAELPQVRVREERTQELSPEPRDRQRDERER
jgi:predicted ABC-type ATPase